MRIHAEFSGKNIIVKDIIDNEIRLHMEGAAEAFLKNPIPERKPLCVPFVRLMNEKEGIA